MKKLRKLLSLVMIGIFITAMTTPVTTNAATKMIVHFIDVGQGDAILIQYGKTNTLLDTGAESQYKKLSAYLTKIKVSKIKNLMITHPDSDHMGGADLVIKNYKVSNIYMTKYKNTSNEYKEMTTAISKYRVKRTNVKTGSKIDLGGIKGTVLYSADKADDSNSSSIVMKVAHNKKSFLFTGDITAKIENNLVKKYNVNVDVLKVSHHGSNTASAVSFIKETSPTYSILSVGANNNYGHPTSTVLNRLKKYSSNILRTDKKGTIVITSTGTKLTSKTVATSTYYKASSSSSSSSSSSVTSSYCYVTATGSKYHKEKCGNGTYTKATVKEAKARGLTPCSKCYK